ncbi:MAG TPA: hypothetical protein V6D20_07915 [Candidatus Obscuribacterales bacterium]
MYLIFCSVAVPVHGSNYTNSTWAAGYIPRDWEVTDTVNNLPVGAPDGRPAYKAWSVLNAPGDQDEYGLHLTFQVPPELKDPNNSKLVFLFSRSVRRHFTMSKLHESPNQKIT